MKKILTVTVLIALAASLFGCLASRDINPQESVSADKEIKTPVSEIVWLQASHYDYLSNLQTFSWQDSKRFDYLTDKVSRTKDGDRILLGICVSSAATPEFVTPTDMSAKGNELNELFWAEYYRIINEKNPELAQKHSDSKAGSKSDVVLTDEEQEEFTALNRECMLLAAENEAVKELNNRIVEARRKDAEKQKNILSKNKYDDVIGIFKKEGFEIYASYNDETDLGEILAWENCAFAVVGTKEQILSLLGSKLGPGGKLDGTDKFVFPYWIINPEFDATPLDYLSGKINLKTIS